MLRRRTVLAASSASLAFGLARTVLGDELLVQGASPQNLATPTEYFDRLITPTSVFFVRSHFGPPALDPGRQLRVEGMLRRALTLSLEALKAFPEVTITAVLQCAGNGRALISPRVPGVQWVHGAMGQATWTGVRLRDVLDKAGLLPSATHVQLAGADRAPKPTVPAFVRSLPIARALDPTTLLAYRMNGEPLSLSHGAPLRLVVPGWAGDHWLKWLTHLKVQDREAEGFYMQTAYKFPVAPVPPGVAVPPAQMRSLSMLPVKSLIARPSDGQTLAKGQKEVVGIAFSGAAAVASVEVSLDGGRSWSRATFEGEPGAGRWQLFRHRFVQRTAGSYVAMARATDQKGTRQPEEAAWNPSGYFWNGWHKVAFTVAG